MATNAPTGWAYLYVFIHDDVKEPSETSSAGGNTEHSLWLIMTNHVGVLLPPLPNIPPVNANLAFAKDYVDALDWSRKSAYGSLSFYILITAVY